jgi:hypothetical protein
MSGHEGTLLAIRDGIYTTGWTCGCACGWTSDARDTPGAALADDFHESVWRFHCAGLPVEVLTENAFRATGARHVTRSNQFRYFCGICHNQIRDLNEKASELVREEAAPDGA